MGKKILVMMLIVGMMISLIACGTGTKDNSDAVEDKSVRVPSIYVVVDNTNDKSFSELVVRGTEMTAEKFGCKAKVIEYGEDKTKFLPTLENISDSGWDIIVATGYASKEEIESMTKEYLNQEHMLLDQRVDDGLSNVYPADYKGNEGAFLSGALAAMIITTSQDELVRINEDKVVGFTGDMDMALINGFTVGFIQSIQFIDPEVKMITPYTNSFTDVAKGKELVKIMYNSECDMVYDGAGRTGMGCLEAGEEAGRCSIGMDSDQALLFKDDPDKANLVLASRLKCLDENIVRVAEKYIAEGEILGKNEALGLAEDMIWLVGNGYYKTNVPEWMRDKILELTEMIKNGEIKVDTAYRTEDVDMKSIIDGARL